MKVQFLTVRIVQRCCQFRQELLGDSAASCHPTMTFLTNRNMKDQKTEPALFSKWSLFCSAGVALGIK